MERSEGGGGLRKKEFTFDLWNLWWWRHYFKLNWINWRTMTNVSDSSNLSKKSYTKLGGVNLIHPKLGLWI
jgi:hypothetical protein